MIYIGSSDIRITYKIHICIVARVFSSIQSPALSDIVFGNASNLYEESL